MPSISRPIATCALSALAGCYIFFPAKLPPPSRVALVPGEEMTIKTREVKTFIGSCSDHDIETGHCEMRDGKLQRWYMQTHAKVMYGKQRLNYAEIRELGDPEYAKQLETVKDQHTMCTVSLVPSALAVISIAVGVLAPLLEAGKLTDDQKTLFYIGGGIGAVGFGALSYPLGGYACVKANRAAKQAFDWSKDDWEGDGERFQKIVDDFNTRIRSGGGPTPAPAPETTPDDATPADAPPDDATPDRGRRTTKREQHVREPKPAEPPATPAPIVSPARDALVGTGKFPSFVAAIDNAKAWDRFAAPAYTIFAPSEEAFAALEEKDRTYLLTTPSGMVVPVLGNHVAYEKLTRAQIAKETRIDTHGGRREPITKKGKQLLIDGAVIGDPIETPDGVIYPIDKILR